MDIDLTCLEASEYLSDSIDGRLDPDLKSALQAHLSRCSQCRFELALMEGTRTALRTRMQPAAVPADLRRQILSAVSTGGAMSFREPRGSREPLRAREDARVPLFQRWRVPLAFAGAVGLAFAAFAILTQRSQHNHTRPLDGNVVTESFNNYDEVIEGRLKPSIVSEKPAEVRDYLEKRVHFPVRVPAMKDYRLVGGQYSAVDNETTAYLIYEHDGRIIFLSQADARKLIGGKRRFIPPAALAEMRRSGWFFVGNVTDCNLAMWLADSTLCTAVADVHRESLLANLAGATAP